jgi:hypothetical protein
MISIPSHRSLPQLAKSVYIAHDGVRANARQAILVSEAPTSEASAYGETYFFRASREKLRAGMRLDVWVPLHDKPVNGVLLPLSAIVWHSGKPWVYARTDDELFIRRAVPAHSRFGDAWFVREGLSAGDSVVVSGSQMLLSEEFRWQIPQEDDD